MASNRSTHLKKTLKLLTLWASALLLTIGLNWSSLPAAPLIPVQAAEPAFTAAQTQTSDPHQLVQQGRQYYYDGQWQDALTVWQDAEAAFAAQGDTLNQAMALNNQAMAYQQLEQFPAAQQAINASRELLDFETLTSERARILAQALNTQASLQLAQGKAQTALNTWEQATDLYRQLGEDSNIIRSQINQAQALRAQGFYSRAQDILEQVEAQLEPQPNSLIKAVGLYHLGNTFRLIGRLNDSKEALEESLTIAKELGSGPDINAALFSLGNLARSRQTPTGRKDALEFYQQAVETDPSPTEWMQAQVNRLGLLIDDDRIRGARELWPQIQDYIELHASQLSHSRTGLYVQMSFAQNVIKLKQRPSEDFNVSEQNALAQLLNRVEQQAKDLKDKRAESYALGYQGHLYEQTQQWSDAEKSTRRALSLARQLTNPADVAYRWWWQLGRIFEAQGETEDAIAAYTEAVDSLIDIRQDLAVISADIQFSFRESVEPVYRKLVALLLQSTQTKSDADSSKDPLEQAREVIESLQVAELDDFFKQACLEVTPVVVEKIDPKTALVYSILLEKQIEGENQVEVKKQIEIVLRLPDQTLHHYSTTLDEDEFEATLDELRKVLVEDPIDRGRFNTDRVLTPAKTLYDWLLRPAESDLAESDIETIAFVLDGPLRNIPMAVLHDGQQYLIEKYSLALSPGLQLINPQPLPRGKLKALAAGLSESVSGDFPELPEVPKELEAVRKQIPGSTVLLNQDFTKTEVQSALERSYYPVVHLATHGQFGSTAEKTFIVSWPSEEEEDDDYQINVNEIQNLLQSQDLTGQEAIELLVLSACQTAKGDDRAALGLAGVAFRAGARSTIATLWPVSDEATTSFMQQFYQELTNPTITKGEALRRAQNFLLRFEDKKFAHPFYWAPYTLIGNWL